MNANKDLERFKQSFIEGYIDKLLDRLLDLRNTVKRATSFDEVKSLMEQEQLFLENEFGIKTTKKRSRNKKVKQKEEES